jgi:cysteine synthase
MSSQHPALGPTLKEMKDPSLLDPKIRDAAHKAKSTDILDPLNLYNLGWHDVDGKIPHVILPKAITGVEANIVVLSGRRYPTGSHKVGPAYSILREHQLTGELEHEKHTLIFPSTGNFGIGGAWVGPRMGYKSTVVLPEEMSAERFEKIRGYGADIIATPGSESNVKEIYDKVKELRRDEKNRILNQFEEFGNYRFHYHVTGDAALKITRDVGNGRVAAFVSAMGSSGTIAAGDFLKSHFGDTSVAVVGLEPIQCPTLYNVGFGAHRIEGIGDKHVTWIHNVGNMDFMMCIDDMATVRGMQLLQDGGAFMQDALGLSSDQTNALVDVFGMSGVCNVLGAIKTAKALGLGAEDNVVTLATDGYDRYPSVSQWLTETEGEMTRDVALRRIDIFHNATTDWVLEGTREVRTRWHNQKYFTWVEQQGKKVEELRALEDQSFWQAQADEAEDVDKRWEAHRDTPELG